MLQGLEIEQRSCIQTTFLNLFWNNFESDQKGTSIHMDNKEDMAQIKAQWSTVYLFLQK